MGHDNNSTTSKSVQTATNVKDVSVFSKGKIIEVKLNQLKRSPAAKLSSRPSKSVLKSKSLTKPFKGRL
ncbi:MAG: hypothetical protein VXV96_13130 [Bdellovibrionota bacterium]|jgi:hypothetical protein|nr:hypothetical protein [Bdellovibrionota bacterium]